MYFNKETLDAIVKNLKLIVKNTGRKEMDVWIQDQTTAPFHRYFMTEDKTDITLTSPITKDDMTVNVSEGHGFTAGGEYMLINYDGYSQQSKVVNVSTNAITLESPVGINVPIVGTQIIRGSIEMNIDGSVTPVTFYCRIGAGSSPIDIQRLHVFMLDASDGDQSTYGGISSGLTNGLFVRYEDGVGQNLGVYKMNSDFVEFGGTATYNDKAPSGLYSTDFEFSLKNVYGIVIRLGLADGSYLKAIVRDNLTLLNQHRIVALGQVTLGE